MKKKVKFDMIPMHVKSKSIQCIHEKALFSVYFGLAVSSAHISLRTTVIISLLSTEFYGSMITNLLCPELDDSNDTWFSLDGTKCHIVHDKFLIFAY